MKRRYNSLAHPVNPRPRFVEVFIALVLGVIISFILFCFLVLWLMVHPAGATWKPQYAQLPQATRDWYETRTLTPASEARFHFHSCCSNSDTVETQFKVNKVDGGDEWYWLDGSTWKQVPPDIIHWDEHNPNGKATIFVIPGGHEPTCFFPPESGS